MRFTACQSLWHFLIAGVRVQVFRTIDKSSASYTQISSINCCEQCQTSVVITSTVWHCGVNNEIAPQFSCDQLIHSFRFEWTRNSSGFVFITSLKLSLQTSNYYVYKSSIWSIALLIRLTRPLKLHTSRHEPPETSSGLCKSNAVAFEITELRTAELRAASTITAWYQLTLHLRWRFCSEVAS